MRTTFCGERYADYLGVDPSDRYAKRHRPIDVCGLFAGDDGRLRASFWQWHWDAPGADLNVQAILTEVLAARKTLVDGPQALARPGSSMRVAERLCAAAGKTPDRAPESGPYSGFIRSSLELFAACAAAGVTIGELGAMAETYPGAAWRRLAPGLPNKQHRAGRMARAAVLEHLGVNDLPAAPSHDQLDACLCALLAAAIDGRVEGISVQVLGLPLHQDADGTWREGGIVVVSPTLPAIATTQSLPHEVIAMPKSAFTSEQHQLAQKLSKELVAACKASAAQLCTYAWAYQHIFTKTPEKWSQAYTNQVTAIARSTEPQHLPGLGPVRLDTFIVAAGSRRLGAGHWSSAPYTQAQWDERFAKAAVRQVEKGKEGRPRASSR